MDTGRRIFKNVSVLFISRVLGYILAFLYIIYTARYLGAEGFGILSFALSFTSLFAIIADLGLNTLIVREIARDKSSASKYLGNTLSMKILLSIITIFLVDLTINILGYPLQTIEIVYLIVLYVIFSSFSQTFYSIFQAYEKMEYQAIGEILNNILMLAGVLLVIYYKLSVLSFGFIYLITSLIILGYCIIFCALKFILPKLELKIKWTFWKATLKEALPFGMTGIFTTIYISIDSVMLSFIQGNDAVGLYNAAYKIIALLSFIPFVINLAVYPSMSRFHLTSPKTLKRIVWKYFDLMIILGIPILIGTSILAPEIILLIFGKGYEGSIIALQVLIWTTLFVFANSPFVQLFQSINKQFTVTKIIGLGTLLNVILNIILIPKFSLVGAGIATALAELTFTILLIISTYKMGYGIKIRELGIFLFKVITSGLIMGIFILLLKSITNLFLLILVATILYFVVLYIIKGIKEEDIKILKEIIFKQNT